MWCGPRRADDDPRPRVVAALDGSDAVALMSDHPGGCCGASVRAARAGGCSAELREWPTHRRFGARIRKRLPAQSTGRRRSDRSASSVVRRAVVSDARSLVSVAAAMANQAAARRAWSSQDETPQSSSERRCTCACSDPPRAPASAGRSRRSWADRLRRGQRPNSYSMCSSSAAGRRSSARASFVIVRSRGSRPARSSRDTSVRCRLQASPRASCDRPAASRAARRFVANCGTGSTRSDTRGLRTTPLQTTHCAPPVARVIVCAQA